MSRIKLALFFAVLMVPQVASAGFWHRHHRHEPWLTADQWRTIAGFGRVILGDFLGTTNAESEATADTGPLANNSNDVATKESAKLQEACTSLKAINELRKQFGLAEKVAPECGGGPGPIPLPGGPGGGGGGLPPPIELPAAAPAAAGAPASLGDVVSLQQYARRWAQEAERQAEIAIVASREGRINAAQAALQATRRAAAQASNFAARASVAQQSVTAAWEAKVAAEAAGAPAGVKQAPLQAPAIIQAPVPGKEPPPVELPAAAEKK